MSALPDNTPRAVLRTLTALRAQNYAVDRLVWHPGYREPLVRLYLTGPRWLLVMAGLAWLTAWGLYRFPYTRDFGATLILRRATLAPIIYVDADGVAH